MKLELRKNKAGAPVVYGPLEAMHAGMIVKVNIAGKWKRVEVRSLGRPFDVGGVRMVYGYLTGDGHTHHVSEALPRKS